MLRRLGWESGFAGNGQELLDLVRDKDFDFIFMDVQMPLIDGLEARRPLGAGEAVRKSKVLKLSSSLQMPFPASKLVVLKEERMPI
jgi:CheY-like chemotaxis protein